MEPRDPGDHLDLSGTLHALRAEFVGVLKDARTLEIRGQRLTQSEWMDLVEDIARRAEGVIDALDEALSSPEKVARRRPPVAPVGSTARLVADELSDFARSCRVSIVLGVPSGLYAAMPVDALRQVLHNLTIDACRFARPDSVVQVRARRERDEVLVDVSHRGGSEGDDVRLATLDDAARGASDVRPGVALTLKVVRALVQAFGGVTSVTVTNGRVTFSLALPGVPSGRNGLPARGQAGPSNATR